MHSNGNLRGRAARRGMTLVESVISITVVVGVMSSVTVTTLSVSEARRELHVGEQIDGQGRRALEFLTNELAGAGRSGIYPQPTAPLASSTLRYRMCQGYANENELWSATRKIALELEPGEVDDGSDNNGNGLADERMLVWHRDDGLESERAVVQSHWIRELLEGEVSNGEDDNGNGLVDEEGLCFWFEDGLLEVALTIELPLGDGRVETHTARTTVRVEN